MGDVDYTLEKIEEIGKKALEDVDVGIREAFQADDVVGQTGGMKQVYDARETVKAHLKTVQALTETGTFDQAATVQKLEGVIQTIEEDPSVRRMFGGYDSWEQAIGS